MGSKVVPAFMVLNTPPLATAMYHTDGCFGLTTISEILPEVTAGPKLRKPRAEYVSDFKRGFLISAGVLSLFAASLAPDLFCAFAPMSAIKKIADKSNVFFMGWILYKTKTIALRNNFIIPLWRI